MANRIGQGTYCLYLADNSVLNTVDSSTLTGVDNPVFERTDIWQGWRNAALPSGPYPTFGPYPATGGSWVGAWESVQSGGSIRSIGIRISIFNKTKNTELAWGYQNEYVPDRAWETVTGKIFQTHAKFSVENGDVVGMRVYLEQNTLQGNDLFRFRYIGADMFANMSDYIV